ncbi:MAG: hypothetical protein ABI574_19255 [Burkholderiales bacterium]
MAQPHPAPALPRATAWDITFTRLAQAMLPQVEAFALDLARRFQALGLGVEREGRQTPRGLSTFLAIVGERGLICIVDLTLVDGMATCQGPCAALDIRLLDACGDVVAEGLAHGMPVRNAGENLAAQALMSDKLGRAATAIYVATLGHFELLRPVARYG